MSSTDASPTHRRGAAVTDAILVAAVQEVAARRSVDISMEAVAERAGVNKTTVYRRWPTSSALVAAAISRQAAAAVPIPDSGDLRTDLTQLCRSVADNLGSPLAQALLSAGLAGGDRHAQLDEQRAAFWTQRFRAASVILTRQLGHRDEADTEMLMEWLVGPIHFRILQRRLEVDDAYIDQLVDGFVSRLPAAATSTGTPESLAGHVADEGRG